MNKPLVIAHRGSSEYEPPNSIEAILLAARQGSDMIEMDIRITKDQILVINHDEALKRLRPSVRIRNYTYDELVEMGFTLPKLEEVLHILPENILVNLDLKISTMDLALKELLKIKDFEKRVFFDTTNAFVLHRYQFFFPHAHYVLSASSPVDPLGISNTFLGRAFIYLIPLLLSYPLRWNFKRKINRVFTEYVSLYPRLCQKRDVEFYHSLGIKVFVFGVNKEVNMHKFIAMGVDGIKTDRPDVLYSIIHEKN